MKTTQFLCILNTPILNATKHGCLYFYGVQFPNVTRTPVRIMPEGWYPSKLSASPGWSTCRPGDGITFRRVFGQSARVWDNKGVKTRPSEYRIVGVGNRYLVLR